MRRYLLMVGLCAALPGRGAAAEHVSIPAAGVFDAHHPGATLGSQIFHIPASGVFSWEAWEELDHEGEVVIDHGHDLSRVRVERSEHRRVYDAAQTWVLQMYTLTVAATAPVDSVFSVSVRHRNCTTAACAEGDFDFALHIVAAGRYLPEGNNLSQRWPATSSVKH